MWCLIILCLFCVASDGARILGVIPTPSYSHQMAYKSLWKELSLRGHEITLLTTDPLNDASLSNLTEIDLSFLYDIRGESAKKHMSGYNLMSYINNFIAKMTIMAEALMQHSKVQNLIHDNSINFDLVMIEHLIPSVLAFQHRFNCSLIGLLSLDASSITHEIMGNPSHPILYPTPFLPFDENMSFIQRLISIGFEIYVRYLIVPLAMPVHDSLVKKYFGENTPSLEEINEKIDMLFLFTDPIFHPIRPTVPAVINIGGSHIQKAKNISEVILFGKN